MAQFEFLTKQQMMGRANSIFTKTPSPNVSEKYTHISTETLIDDMDLMGWKVVDCKQIKSAKKAGYQKHMIIFRNQDIFIQGEDGDNVFPQILLTNSHDGGAAFTFRVGLFRLICSNGLVLSTQDFANLKIRHMGYNFDTLQNIINDIIEKLPLTVESMNRFKKIQLDQEQILMFAKDVLKLRLTEDKIESVDIEEFISPTRKQDEGSDLWKVFNNIQEKLLSGNYTYSNNHNNKFRKARKIKNFQQDIEMNEKLFNLAFEYSH
jgi:hypothetical protein